MSETLAYQAHMGVLKGVIRAPGFLRTPEPWNYQADSLQIMFIETVLVGGRAKSWADSLQIKFIGSVLARKHALGSNRCAHGHNQVPVTMLAPEISNRWAYWHQI